MAKTTKNSSAHKLMTTDGKFIYGKNETEAILEMINSGWDHTTYEGKRLTVVSDYRSDEERVTVIGVE